MKTVTAAALALHCAMTTVSAQTGMRTMIDTKKFWTPGGSEQTSKVVKDAAIPGGRYIEITSTGRNSRYSANLSYRLVGVIKAGERLTLSGTVRAAAPTTLSINAQLVEQPYTRIGGGDVDVTPEWKPFTVAFVPAASHAAGTAKVIVQLNSEARTVAFGPLTVTAAAE